MWNWHEGEEYSSFAACATSESFCRHHDSHQIPFSMDIDFDTVVKALKEINYSGWFTLESSHYLASFDKDTVFFGVQNMTNAAKKHACMFDSLV